ncbi:hypothetical protein [Alkalibacterium sp. MB6]|uniref:hypothetical protein n=1 Tax=Alkalibacterium sp. MB6 TaxID=2081965 RepID=UPI00137A0462|nr:hypothetical protein [Alkalibacterium sp. MB6]
MDNNPSLNHDQQHTADHLIKAKGVKETKEYTDPDENLIERDLSEEEKEKATHPDDFEPFDLSKLDEKEE